MSDQEGFLTRWSRRKRATGEGDSQEAPVESPPRPDPLPTSGERDSARSSPAEAKGSSRGKSDDTAFDPASLPSLESIGAGTDIRAFLTPGVPAELTQAALRRAWSADPAIRDFIGPAENAWDFTAPDGVPGFGSLTADEVQRLAAQFFGPSPVETDAAAQAESPSPETVAAGDTEATPAEQSSDSPAPPPESAPVEGNTTAQEELSPEPPRRRHGSALAE